MSNKIERNCVPSAVVDTKEFCLFGRNNDFLETTKWNNEEGFVLHRCKQQVSGDFTDEYFSFTFGEFDAIKKLVKSITK